MIKELSNWFGRIYVEFCKHFLIITILYSGASHIFMRFTEETNSHHLLSIKEMILL